MEKIINYTPLFEDYINDLIDVLYKQEYFGFYESAVLYVIKIYDFIIDNIDSSIPRSTPKKFQKFGEKYLKYKANNQTSWYIFFYQKGNHFLVNYIMNNHSEDFPELV